MWPSVFLYLLTYCSFSTGHRPIANKAAIDRRHRPRCCHLGSYFKRPKSRPSPVRPLACSWYYCAQIIAKPKAACGPRISWAVTSSNLGLWANMTSSVKPEVHSISLRRQRRTEPRPWVTGAQNLAKIGRVVPNMLSRTDKHRQTHSSQYSAPCRGSIRITISRIFLDQIGICPSLFSYR